MDPRLHTRLTDQPLAPDAALAFCSDPDAGAVVVFTGTVRAHNDGRAVTALDYEAYAERATAQMTELGERALRDFPELAKVFIEHRTGTLAIGEPAVVVGAAAAHRGQAFDAARWLIDTLKATVAIWKREHWADGGAHWPGADVAVGG